MLYRVGRSLAFIHHGQMLTVYKLCFKYNLIFVLNSHSGNKQILFHFLFVKRKWKWIGKLGFYMQCRLLTSLVIFYSSSAYTVMVTRHSENWNTRGFNEIAKVSVCCWWLNMYSVSVHIHIQFNKNLRWPHIGWDHVIYF